jgi:hypothetical protein
MKMMEYLARALALLWAGFWMFFFIVESLAWGASLDRTAIWVAVGVVFVILALAAWRWEVGGGLALVAAGLAAALAYAIWGPRELSFTSRMTTLLAFGLPPVAAGALFLMHHHSVTRSSGAHG